MHVGDILEWIAGAAFTASAYLATRLAWPSLIVAGVFLAYQAQCYAGYRLPWPNLPRLRLQRVRLRLRRKQAE